MKKNILTFTLCVLISISLGGCLDMESSKTSIDLENSKAEIIYKNIVSNAKTESEIKDDFEGLLITAYERKGDGQEVTLVTSELYEKDGVLNGRKTYIINDMDALLENYGIITDYRGYVMNITDEGTKYVGGNGVLIESSAGRQVVWDKNSKVLEAELKYDTSSKQTTSMLPMWKKWIKWDEECGPESVNLLSRSLGEMIKEDRDNGTIDFCPNGTCYSFSTDFVTPGAFNRLGDFVYIYLQNMVDDPALKKFKAEGEDLMIVDRNMLDCPEAGEHENARCALRHLHRKYDIKLLSVEYGKMESKQTPIDLATELGE